MVDVGIQDVVVTAIALLAVVGLWRSLKQAGSAESGSGCASCPAAKAHDPVGDPGTAVVTIGRRSR